MRGRINLMEFVIKSMKMFDNVEDILVYDKENDKYYRIEELYHISNSDKEYMVIEI